MKTLQTRGHSFELVSLNPLGELAPLLEEAGVPSTGLLYDGIGGWKVLSALVQKLWQADVDVFLMTGHHLFGSVASWACRSQRSILAIHFHHMGVKPTWQWRLIYRAACARFDAITFPTDFIRAEAERIYPPVARKSWTIRNPVPLPESVSAATRSAARERLSIGENDQVVGNAGWLIPRKRWDVFLHTAERVLRTHPNALFLIAGGGPEEGNLVRLAAELGVTERVRWLGWRRDLHDFYHALDVMLFHSDWDALGLSPLEAMSHGVPIVASVVNGGLKEILVHGRDGFLLSSHDCAQLSELVSDLLADGELRATMGLAGRRRIAEACNPQVTADGYERLFSRVDGRG